MSPPNLPGWDDVHIVKYFEQKYNIKTVLENDANACALAEWQFGAGKDKNLSNVIFITCGTGFGAGLILDGRLYSGTNGMAGEIGHIRYEKFGPVGYGKSGTFEGFCSGGGIAQIAKMKLIELFQTGKKASFCNNIEDIDKITAKTVADAANNGNTKKYAEDLAKSTGADLCQITEVKKRSKLGAFIPGIIQVMRGSKSKINPVTVDFTQYDKIIIAFPVWASHQPPAINSVVDLLPDGEDEMFLDKVDIYVKGGSGGNGCVSFHREKYVSKGGPDGGDGGKGGNVIFKIDEGKNTLLDFKHRRRFIAENGDNGKTGKMYGKSAPNIYISVPPGTLIKDSESGKIIKDMSNCGEFIIAKGGKGGWGNRRFATSTRQAPNFAKNGLPGEEKKLTLELKMLADVGLIGYPNVGKSSILNIMSMANPKIANYHFTTLSPNLGVVSVDDDFAFVMADIPGLIEGASDGIGLGHDFLRHIERCRLLIHVVDIASSEERDPIDDLANINIELAKYNEELIDRPQIIAANKIDLLEDEQDFEKFKEFEEYAKNIGCEIVYISAATGKNIDKLLEKIIKIYPSLPPLKIYESETFEQEYILESENNTHEVDIHQNKGIYYVEAEWLFKVVNSVNFDDRESVMYFQRVLNKSGVIDKLRKAGINEGDTVNIYDMEFDFVD
ncbi:developmentally regulated gtp-binding protein-related [Holotrichia oblita]|nr:developmentally regulated gtp-binding protein-related [Holotrichia oblita]